MLIISDLLISIDYLLNSMILREILMSRPSMYPGLAKIDKLGNILLCSL